MSKSLAVVSLQNVTKKFSTFSAVSDITVDISRGEIVGFVGVNGAGKSTTINLLLGFTSPTNGNVYAFGKKVTPANAHISHRRIGYAAGDMELPKTLTGAQYLSFVMHQSKGDHAKRFAELISIFKPQLEKRIGSLSRGNKQKIALVAAFVSEPELVVLDEPTSGLDPIMQEAFLEVVRSEQGKGTTIFMSSHYLQEVAEVCTRVLLMKNGRIVEDLSGSQLKKTGGKLVEIVSTNSLRMPTKHIRNLTHEHPRRGLVTRFVYDGSIASLQVWLSELKGVKDITITNQTLDAEFKSLYDEVEAA